MREHLGFDHRHYVPCLRWKMGEYQAILELRESCKDRLTPLIEVPEIGFDFETREVAKTIDQHLEKLAVKVGKKWNGRSVFVDLNPKLIGAGERMRDKRHPLKFVFDDLRAKRVLAIPVTGLGRDRAYQEAVLETIRKDSNGVCVRVSVEEAASGGFEKMLSSLLKTLGVKPEDVDFVLDLGAPNFEPLEGFTKMVRAVVEKTPNLDEYRTYTVCGTSFPQSMGELKIGVGIVKRYEWLFYKMLLHSLGAGVRKPTFGDYGIAHPKVVPPVDPRHMKPAASVRYTIDDAWYIIKGTNIRDNGNQQYRRHCSTLISSGVFMGDSFSAGDQHIRMCAQGLVNPGNLTTWRRVGTNHHLQKVVADIANLCAS